MIHFVIPGEPIALARPRAMSFGGHARVYEPTKSPSAQWKGKASWLLREAMGGAPPLTGPVTLAVVFTFALPKSHWKKKVPVAEHQHTKRPDLDNLVKNLLDAANGVVVMDDSQVCNIRATKVIGRQGMEPSVIGSFEEEPDFRQISVASPPPPMGDSHA